MPVARVGSLRSSSRLPVCWQVLRTAMTWGAALPVEKLFLGRSSRKAAVAIAPAVVDNPAPDFERPGCEAADQTIVVHGHLQGLADGLGGFGLLRTSKERLEKASSAARQSNAPDVASTIDGVAKQLPDVRTPEQAAALARQLDPVIPKVWELGARCGKSVSPDTIGRADELARKLNAGEITKSEAVAALQAHS